MVDERPAGVGRESLSAELIAQRGFMVSRRGFDQEEVRKFLVRVSAEVQALHARIEEVEAQRRDAEERAAHPVLDEDVLMEAVGEETASILRTARAAASDLKRRAEEEAARLVDEAQVRAGDMRTIAEEAGRRIVNDAEAAAEQRLAEAQAQVQEMTTNAREEADAVRAQAEKERKMTVEAAQAVREKILADLSRRRRVATVQIEQLRAGRQRLLDSYALVRRTLEEVHDDLQRADAEARAAADEAGQRADRELPRPDMSTATSPVPDGPDQVGLLDEPTEAVSVVDLEGDDEPEGGAEPAVEEAGEAASGEAVPAEAVPAEAVGAEAAESPAVAAAEDEPAVEPGGGGEGVRIIKGEEAASRRPSGGVATKPAPARTSTSAGTSPRTSTPSRPKSKSAKPGPMTDSVQGKEETAKPVDQLFARIRADREGAVAKAMEVLGDNDEVPSADLEADADVSADAEPDGQEDEARSDEDEALLELRDKALLDVESGLTRKLKRALQDEQNDLLDRLRGLRGTPTATKLLPAAEEHPARFAAAARPLLTQAAAAGMAFAVEVRHKLGLAPYKAADAPDIDDLTMEAAESITEPLRRRLEQAIQSSAGDDQAVLVEALGAAYREWKSQRIERTAGDVVDAAFARGVLRAVPSDGLVRWIADDLDGACPDCDDDALEGSCVAGTAFPTGQVHPPAHPGCRCVLVPAAE